MRYYLIKGLIIKPDKPAEVVQGVLRSLSSRKAIYKATRAKFLPQNSRYLRNVSVEEISPLRFGQLQEFLIPDIPAKKGVDVNG